MLGFIKKSFFTGLSFLLTLASVNLLSAVPLSCISMNNQECKVGIQIVNLNRMNLCFFFLVLKQVNAIVVATISIIICKIVCF